jgi:hypothetical protein
VLALLEKLWIVGLKSCGGVAGEAVDCASQVLWWSCWRSCGLWASSLVVELLEKLWIVGLKSCVGVAGEVVDCASPSLQWNFGDAMDCGARASWWIGWKRCGWRSLSLVAVWFGNVLMVGFDLYTYIEHIIH